MQAGTVNPAEFRDGQRQQWETAAAGWRKWSPTINAGANVVSERMVELAGIESGSRVLDIACGYGEPALTAARKAGPDGRVVATDISDAMIAFGRERAEADGLDNIEFIQSGAIALDFEPGTFNAALSRWGIIFDPEAEAAAARVHGFLEPGSRMAISSWGPPDRVPMLGVALRTALEHLQLEPPPPGMPGPFARPSADALAGLLEAGGFSDVAVEEATVTFVFESPEDFATYVRDIAPPIVMLLSQQPEEVREKTWALIADAARPLAGDDGKVTMPNLALVASGRA